MQIILRGPAAGYEAEHTARLFFPDAEKTENLPQDSDFVLAQSHLCTDTILLRLYAQWLTRQISSSFSNFLLTKRERTCPHIGQMRLASLLTISFYHEKPPQGKGFSVKNP